MRRFRRLFCGRARVSLPACSALPACGGLFNFSEGRVLIPKGSRPPSGILLAALREMSLRYEKCTPMAAEA